MALQAVAADPPTRPRGTTMLGSVRVYLCRHAKAAPGEPDDLRELTPKGRRQAEALGEQLAAQDFAGLGLIALGLAAIDGRLLSLLRVRRPQTVV